VLLSSEFHFIMADLLDNPDVSRSIRELVGRTRLSMALYHQLAGRCYATTHEESPGADAADAEPGFAHV
jgi:hypothetical protein